MSPLLVLFLSILLIVIGIAVLRLHAFVVLLLVAFTVGIIGVTDRTAAGVVELALQEFGIAVGKIGFVIALAAMIGVFLTESGAADKIVRRLVAVCGENRAPIALMLGGFILSVPVFFDTVFFLLIPLARALCLRTGKNYLYYVLAICCGGTIAHSLVPPTPGPLATAELLGLDLGTVMLAGILASLPVCFGMLALARWISARLGISLREAAGVSLAELKHTAEQSENELPGLGVSLLPIFLPLVLIGTLTVFGPAAGTETLTAGQQVLVFLGNKNIALLCGAIAAGVLWFVRQSIEPRTLRSRLQIPLEAAGVIILITGAGGAYGAMIKHAGIGPALQEFSAGWGIGPILLAWGLTWLIRLAQGSATVAMLTAGSVMAAVIGDGSGLGFHPIYIFLAIGFGSKSISWMNDSAFWVIGRMTGLTESETLRTWTAVLAFGSVLGLIEVLLLTWLLPLSG